MSTTTVTRRDDYEIREGVSTSFDGGDHHYIEGLVLGEVIVNAFQSDDSGTRWVLATYAEYSELAGVPRPTAAEIGDAHSARQWVEILTSVYAKAAAALEDL